MADNTYMLTPVGRIVQGHPMEEQTKDHKGRPLTNQKGEPRVQYFFAIAISKTDPGVQAVIQAAVAAAQVTHPGILAGADNFSWKYIDGDTDHTRPGFAGCWVFKCTSGFAIKCFTKDGAAPIYDMDQIKRGYFCRASISWKANGDTDKPGVYLNCNGFELYGYGEVIETGPSGPQLFGTAPATVPAGITAAPVAAGSGMAPPATTLPPQAGPAAQTAPQSLPPQATPSHTGNFLNPTPAASVLPGPPVPAPTPHAPIKRMTEKAQGCDYDTMIAAGWTDETMIAQGYMVLDEISR